MIIWSFSSMYAKPVLIADMYRVQSSIRPQLLLTIHSVAVHAGLLHSLELSCVSAGLKPVKANQ